MTRSKTSKQWLQQHFADDYVKRAQKEGYRSRAAYKLLEIQQKDKIIKPGMIVVDLGAAPGGWSEVAAKLVGEQGKIFAVDILAMEPISNVKFMQGDFTDEVILNKLLQKLDNLSVDLVLSDMAPNISGIKTQDQSKSMYLVELALDFAKRALSPRGVFLTKVFQGEGFDALLQNLRNNFQEVKVRKPKASRSKSREIYLLAKGYRGC